MTIRGTAAAMLAAAAMALAAAPRPRPAAAPDGLSPPERQAVREWMRRLSLRERVAQLVMVPFYGDSPGSATRAWRDFQHLVRDVRIGGLVLLNSVENGVVRNAEPHALGAFLNRVQKQARVPLIVAGDFERGASMRVAGTPRYPHAMAYGAAGDTRATRAI
ncbi:MAG: glycoside hydrolase family 3 N-terminal domain-containing protein, partial [Bryobacterales bacterium]|nr:glycoside hydrolase family 3 N-terminal domain-containing protein [Bryobacterales bacterium]